MLTHSHFDHGGAALEVQKATGAPVYIHRAQEELQGLPVGADLSAVTKKYVVDGDVVTAGLVRLKAIATPGHAPGSVSWYLLDAGPLFTGDLLFKRGVGRTDLTGGSEAELKASLARLKKTLPPATRVLPGHGDETTLAAELGAR